MTNFDLVEVRNFAANLDARIEQCDNGEGMECANLDATLQQYAKLCCELRDKVREWGRAVFTGRVAFDPEVEQVWMDECFQLYVRAAEMASHGLKAESSCWVLDGQGQLQAALWGLYQLLNPWVTPHLAVGPSARQRAALSQAATDEARRRIEALPRLPADWRPDDPRQRSLYRKLRKS